MTDFYSEALESIQALARQEGSYVADSETDRVFIKNDIRQFLIVLKKMVHPGDDSYFTNTFPTEDMDFPCYYLWEDLWLFHRKKIESKLKSVFGLSSRVHGRACTVRDITNKDLTGFLEKNHLNVPIRAKYKYGLYHKGELMAVISFSKGRPIYRNGLLYNSYELLRFCNKLDTTVVGGFSKLLRHFISQQHPDDIMTYVDRDWSDGATYKKLGFERIDDTGPMEFWLDMETGERIYPHRSVTSHSSNGDPDISLNCPKVYSSGSFKYILLVTK